MPDFMALKAMQYQGPGYPFSRKHDSKQDSWKIADSECGTSCVGRETNCTGLQGERGPRSTSVPQRGGDPKANRNGAVARAAKYTVPAEEASRSSPRFTRPHPSPFSSGEWHLSAAPTQPATRRRGEDRHGGGACAAGPRPGGRTSRGVLTPAEGGAAAAARGAPGPDTKAREGAAAVVAAPARHPPAPHGGGDAAALSAAPAELSEGPRAALPPCSSPIRHLQEERGPAPSAMLPPLRRALCRPLRPRARRPARLLAALLLVAALRGGGTALPPGCKYDGRPKSSGKAAAGGPLEVKVVCSNLELARVLPPEALPNRTVTL